MSTNSSLMGGNCCLAYHYIIVGPDQPSAYLTKSPKLYNDAHSAFSVKLLVQEDVLPEILLLSKLDSRL